MAKKTNTQTQNAIDDEPLVKGDDEEVAADGAEDGDDGDEDEDDKDEEEMKSDLVESDLVKALDDLDDLAKASANGVSPRQAQLASKMAKGGTLTKSEATEMTSFLGDDNDEVAKSHKEEFMSDPKVEQGFEVSEFLDALGANIAKSLDGLRDEMTKSRGDAEARDTTFARTLGAMGAVIVAQGKQIKSLEARLVKSEDNDAREPAQAKGRSAVGQRVNDGAPISKGGQKVAQLTKSMILDSLEGALQKSASEPGRFDGVDFALEISRYESTGMVSKPAMKAVCDMRGLNPADYGING